MALYPLFLLSFLQCLKEGNFQLMITKKEGSVWLMEADHSSIASIGKIPNDVLPGRRGTIALGDKRVRV